MSFQVYLRSIDTAYNSANTLRSSVAPSANDDLANKSYVDTTLADASASGTFWQVPVTEQASAEPSTDAVTGSAYANGARVLVGTVTDAADAFYGHDNKIAVYDSSEAENWAFTSPQEGMALWVAAGSSNANSNLVYNGSAWVLMSSISGAVPLTKIAGNSDDLSSVVKILQTSTGNDAPEAGDILALDSANQIVEATAIPSSLLSDATTNSKGIVQITAADFDIASGVLDIQDGLTSGDVLRADAANFADGEILSADGTSSRIDAGTAAEIKSAVGDASTFAKGVASFNSDHFTVSSGAVSLIKGGASAGEFIESISSSFTGDEILKFTNSGGNEGFEPASAADVAGAIQDASTSDQGVASFDSDDFSVSSGDVSLLRKADTSGTASSLPTISSFSDLKEFYCFDLSGSTSAQTLTLPDLQGETGALGRELKISVLTFGSGGSLIIDGGTATNTYDQNLDEFETVTLDQNYQTLRLVCVAVPSAGDSAEKTCWKVA